MLEDSFEIQTLSLVDAEDSFEAAACVAPFFSNFVIAIVLMSMRGKK